MRDIEHRLDLQYSDDAAAGFEGDRDDLAGFQVIRLPLANDTERRGPISAV